MTRATKVGLLWIALVTVVVALWLAVQPQPTTLKRTTATKAVQPTQPHADAGSF